MLFPEDVKPHLDESIATATAKGEYPFGLSCQMTPREVSDVITRYPGGIREMADLVNRDVTYWFMTDYADLARVHTGHDYFLSTDMVQVGISRTLALANMKQRDE